MKRCLHVGLAEQWGFNEYKERGTHFTCAECDASVFVSEHYIKTYAEGVSPYPYQLARSLMLAENQPSKRHIWAARHRKAVSKARMFAATRVR